MAVAQLEKRLDFLGTGEALPEEQKQWQVVARRFSRHRLAVISLFATLAIFAVVLLAKTIAPYGATELEIGNAFASPGSVGVDGRTHWLGTDHLGRDFLSRLVYAGRISLAVAFASVIGSAVIGVVVGAISGYFRGWVDDALMRFVEFLLTIPSLPILLILSSILIQSPHLIPIPAFVLNLFAGLMYIPPREARQVVVVIIVLMSLGWLGAARLMRGMVLSLREQEFTDAARALGASNVWIILRHMIPNAMAPIIVDTSLALAGYVILESALSFLGFGIQDPTPTWGNMLAFTESYMFQHPWLPLVPGIPIFICALVFNFIGDGLRDALDPRLKL
ncbi:MAG: ABC transporter permease [Anaerolineales bacterium]